MAARASRTLERGGTHGSPASPLRRPVEAGARYGGVSVPDVYSPLAFQSR